MQRLKNLASRSKSSTSKDPTTGPSTSDDGTDTTSPAMDLSDPANIAEHIRSLINALPQPASDPTTHDPKKSRTSKPSKPKPISRDKNGRPIPPSDASRIPSNEQQLLSILNNRVVMNGEQSAETQSVWSVLDSLGPPSHDDSEADPPNGGSGDTGDGSPTPHAGSDDTSIMFYAPLIPDANSKVELGKTELVPLAHLKASGYNTVGTLSFSQAKSYMSLAELWSWPDFWPFNKLGHHETAPAPTPPPQVRVWVPSKTHISFQAMWWGYRLYLPPPVLDVLSDETVETSKRIATITTALTWFFSNIPITSFPPAVQPAVLLMQQLVPYIGYLSTFITWSWSTIKSYDVGYGVFLTATWLLPVALIPGTWQQYDFPDPPPADPSPAPAPSDPASSPANPPAGVPNPPTSDPANPDPSTSPNVPATPPPSAPSDPTVGTSPAESDKSRDVKKKAKKLSVSLGPLDRVLGLGGSKA